MTYLAENPYDAPAQPCVVALHCSLGSGRQWTRLAAELGNTYRIIAPDLAGYGDNPPSFDLPMTMAEEVASLGECLREALGPIHLVGHSYGGAIALKLATASPYAARVRSLTLIEPVLPGLLCGSAADRRLHDGFLDLSREVVRDLGNGSVLEAIDKFTAYWNGSGAQEPLSSAARLRMIEHAERLAFDFKCAFSEDDIAAGAASLRLPTLLFSGGQSPFLTQRIVGRLASLMDGAQVRHLPEAGHMLPLTHAAVINPAIASHIAASDELAGVPLAAGPPMAEVIPITRD